MSGFVRFVRPIRPVRGLRSYADLWAERLTRSLRSFSLRSNLSPVFGARATDVRRPPDQSSSSDETGGVRESSQSADRFTAPVARA